MTRSARNPVFLQGWVPAGDSRLELTSRKRRLGLGTHHRNRNGALHQAQREAVRWARMASPARRGPRRPRTPPGRPGGGQPGGGRPGGGRIGATEVPNLFRLFRLNGGLPPGLGRAPAPGSSRAGDEVRAEAKAKAPSGVCPPAKPTSLSPYLQADCI